MTDAAAHARLSSLRARTTSMWLTPLPATCAEGIWMEPQIFTTACQIRLGLAVRDEPARCPRCTSTTPQDVYGHHSLCCMVGEGRCHMHHAVVKRLFADASYGLLHPTRETRTFGDGSRMDLVLRMGVREQLVDVALTCPFRASADALRHAIAAPGGWATAYEQVKRTRYAAMCQPHQDLIPVVFDTFGAAGASALPVLHRVAAAFSKRFGSREGRLIFFTRLMTLIVSKVAAIVRNEA